jgi:hypothetical protein
VGPEVPFQQMDYGDTVRRTGEDGRKTVGVAPFCRIHVCYFPEPCLFWTAGSRLLSANIHRPELLRELHPASAYPQDFPPFKSWLLSTGSSAVYEPLPWIGGGAQVRTARLASSHGSPCFTPQHPKSDEETLMNGTLLTSEHWKGCGTKTSVGITI